MLRKSCYRFHMNACHDSSNLTSNKKLLKESLFKINKYACCESHQVKKPDKWIHSTCIRPYTWKHLVTHANDLLTSRLWCRKLCFYNNIKNRKWNLVPIFAHIHVLGICLIQLAKAINNYCYNVNVCHFMHTSPPVCSILHISKESWNTFTNNTLECNQTLLLKSNPISTYLIFTILWTTL